MAVPFIDVVIDVETVAEQNKVMFFFVMTAAQVLCTPLTRDID
jgi:hypothetical protein